jgi:hypothetical protein
VDIRHTPEAAERAHRLGVYLTFAPPKVLAEEIGQP